MSERTERLITILQELDRLLEREWPSYDEQAKAMREQAIPALMSWALLVGDVDEAKKLNEQMLDRAVTPIGGSDGDPPADGTA